MKSLKLLLTIVALGCFVTVGCDNAKKESPEKSTEETAHDHSHEDGHAHSHDDVHGPNGGHIFSFKPATYMGEWKHYNDNNVIEVYVLDAAGKKNVAVKADSVTIKRTTGDAGDEAFVLEPQDANENGESFKYSLDSNDLRLATALGITIDMKVGDETFSVDIAPHKPHDH